MKTTDRDIGEHQVPSITDLLKIQYELNSQEMFQLLVRIAKNYFYEKQVSYQKTKELQKLEFLNENLIQSQKQRDEMIGYYKEQNFKQSQKIQELQNAQSIIFKSELQKQQLSTKTQSKQYQQQAEQEMLKMKNFKNEVQQLFEKNLSIQQTVNSYQGLNLIQQVKYIIDPIQDSNSSKIIQNLYDENLLNLSRYLQFQKIHLSLLKILQNITLPEMVLRVRNYSREFFDCSHSEVYLLDESNHLIRYQFENLEFIEDKIDSPIHSPKLSESQIWNGKVTQPFINFLLNIQNIKVHSSVVKLILVKEEIVGVMVLANKNDGQFSSDDDQILDSFLTVVALTIQNKQRSQNSFQVYKYLRNALDSANIIFESLSLNELLNNAKQILATTFSSENVNIFLIDWEENVFFNFDDKNERKNFDICGIAQQTIFNKEIQKYIKPNQNTFFNPKVDTDTTCPLITFAIYNSRIKFVTGVVQIQTRKGVTALSKSSNFPIPSYEIEYLNQFIDQFMKCWEKIIN